jgi:acyl-CoA synthetase (AMP-forming)/AMP-acid ligase II
LAAVTTVSFDIAGLEMYLPLLVGACVVMVPREVATDGRALAALLAEERVTVMQATPATWQLLREARWGGNPQFVACCGGEVLPLDLARFLLERVGVVWNLYGPTETTIWSTVGRVEPDQEVTIGRPIANTQVYILDSGGQPTPVGVAGELWIGGAGVASGYWRNPELTGQKFQPDRFLGRDVGGLIYRTGDTGRWLADGRIAYLGRIDQQVKLRGFRIEPGEIEAALTAHEAIREALVVMRGDTPERERLVAYLVYHRGSDLTTSEVREHLRLSLPDYMIPSAVVAIDAVPWTPNGKIDRRALPDPFRSGSVASREFVAPAAGAEQLIARIWADALAVERVGAADNFFDLGGHSLLGLRVAAAIHRQTGWRMPPYILFQQTLRQIAASVEAHQNGPGAVG